MRILRVFPMLAILGLWAHFSPAQLGQGPASLPHGLRIPATLKGSLSTQKAKVGNPVQLEVFAAVHGKDGKILIPAHAMLSGAVTQATPFNGPGHPAVLAFAVQRVEWKGGGGALDAAVFGVLAIPDPESMHFNTSSPKIEFELSQRLRGSGTQGEMVEDLRTATLRRQDSVTLIDCRILYQMTFADRPADASQADIVMDLKVSNDPAVRTYFTSEKHDVELPPDFVVVLLNGMKVIP